MSRSSFFIIEIANVISRLQIHSSRALFAAGLLVVMAVMFLPVEASAFSLGKIRVTGATNEPFKAEIPVRVDGKAGLSADLGSQKDYERIGVDRPPFLDELSVEVADHPLAPGQKIIYVTSSEPVYQPSFNLIVKASLGGGVIMENYFLALDFQKDLNVDLPASKEEKEAMTKIAAELNSLRPNQPERSEDSSSQEMTLEQIRKEEEAAVREDEAKTGRQTSFKRPEKPIFRDKPKHETPEPETEPEAPMPEALKPNPEPALATKATPKPGPTVGEAGLLPVSGQGTYMVKSGDSLYKIAKLLGASRRNLDVVVVALWQNNHQHFIKGNIHGLLSGRRLDYSRVNETSRTMTKAEARRIIMEQWPRWRDQHGVIATAEVSPGKFTFRSKILATLTKWRNSYERGDMKTYLDTYSDSYKVGDVTKQNLAEVSERSGFGKGEMDINFEKVSMTRQGNVIAVTLPGNTEGKSAARKIYFVQEGERYRIVREENAKAGKKLGKAPEPTINGFPYVVHVASFKNEGAAKKMVDLLRKKGFNAFEVLSFVPGKGNWYRVVVNRFASVAEANNFSGVVKKNGLSRYTRILNLPYAIQLGEPITRKEAAAKMTEYSKRGFSTYSLKLGDDGKTSILLGAFDSEQSARNALAALAGLDEPYSVIKP